MMTEWGHQFDAATPPTGSTNRHGQTETTWSGAGVQHWFVDAAGVTFHVVTAGQPTHPPVVFLHGFPETWFAWHHQMARLSSDYFCVAVDLKGFGQSAHPTRHEADYDYAFCATEIAELTTVLGLDRFHLVSHDRGTVIADHLCAVDAMSERITAYVRMQQSGNRPHSEPRPPHELFKSPEVVPMFESGPIIEMAYGVLDRTDGREHIVATPVDQRDVDRMITEIRHLGAAEGMSASFVSAGFDNELIDRTERLFPSMTMPVLFLQGRHDPGQQPAEYDTVTEEVPDGTLQFLDAGHFPHLETPDLVTTAIAEFFQRVSKQ